MAACRRPRPHQEHSFPQRSRSGQSCRNHHSGETGENNREYLCHSILSTQHILAMLPTEWEHHDTPSQHTPSPSFAHPSFIQPPPPSPPLDNRPNTYGKNSSLGGRAATKPMDTATFAASSSPRSISVPLRPTRSLIDTCGSPKYPIWNERS